jgi:hypothetical protein
MSIRQNLFIEFVERRRVCQIHVLVLAWFAKDFFEGIRKKLARTNMEEPQMRIAELNIGGVKYTTTLQTLTQRGPNYFSNLFDERFAASKDSKGAWFIDRDGACA